MRYGEPVQRVCKVLADDTERSQYVRLLVKSFDDDIETDTDLEKKFSLDTSFLLKKAKAFCVDVGACTDDDHDHAVRRDQALGTRDWSDDCTVCRAVASHVEERVYLNGNRIDEASVKRTLATACEHLERPSSSSSSSHVPICQKMISGGSVNELSWRFKTHGENMVIKKRIDAPFPEKICWEMRMCSQYPTPERTQKEERDIENAMMQRDVERGDGLQMEIHSSAFA